jgi:hypothetical protein
MQIKSYKFSTYNLPQCLSHHFVAVESTSLDLSLWTPVALPDPEVGSCQDAIVAQVAATKDQALMQPKGNK